MTTIEAQQARHVEETARVEPPEVYDALWAEHGWGLTGRQVGAIVCCILLVLAGSAVLG